MLSLYIVVDLCFIIRHSKKISTISFKNWGLLSKVISSGVPNQINICSYRNHVIYCFTKDFKACIFCKLCEVAYGNHNELMPSFSH